MNIFYSKPFIDKVNQLPIEAKRVLKKKLELLMENPRHPSLRTRKIQGQAGIFEASITMDIRITWQYTEDGILLRNIEEHDKTLKTP
ncbi:MAG: cytotoxin [Clostridiaceae bacterium BRH_c20a]|nr:MAG: cytotoxin [Clostridiaceae bacterium BRH_c20a]